MADETGLHDPVMARITEAVERGRAGDTVGAREALDAIWNEEVADGDAFHQVVLAHYAADVQDDPQLELQWDERALRAADETTDERAQGYHPSLSVAGFYPSLHLNLADDHRRLGDFDTARHHIAAARERFLALNDDEYGATIRAGVKRVGDLIDAGDTSRDQS